MGMISWLLMGLIVGGLAKMISPGKEGGGLLSSLIIGVAGAAVGGFIASMLGWGEVGGFNLYSMLVALAGALLVLFVWKKFIKK